MKKRLSLQWKLTLMTAFLVIVACLTLSYFISRSAVLYMDDIEDSVIAIFPKELFSEDSSVNVELYIDTTANLSDMVKNTQVEFWGKSLLITSIITLISSTLIYFIVGYALRPLKKLGRQIQDIQAKNMQQPIALESNSIEILRLIDAFNGMLKRLNNAFSAQRQFSANAAHELRTPLAVMQTKVEVFEKNKNPGNDDYQEAIDMVKIQTDRLSHVIDILLEMTELQSAKRSDHISLAELTEEVICDLVAVGDKKGISLTQKPGDAQIMGSDMLIYRAIYNLIENAIKYNHQGGEVSVEIKENDEYARVIVSDTGSGIDKNDWEQIFEPFFRVDKSRSRAMGGAGLGLALVREIARQHGGDVCVLQSSAQGTQIELSLLLG
ncbi:Signal transduction histidine kinase [Tissierella praeacuta DSM 18095]|uniref:histidine kinase n=1 Tax=Tissierella praeacuta DSM 18095 TaxID=1123404 RepID=A0A1M4XGR2_9FIRM|nr:ATP-binding protein [Tissierella praeacuta]SHE92744.1 Signal transduction histidine kinase [Tissierella praeacuta DSM 18095]SUP02132.1 Sensor kinase CusS [Tissierella praeacuta]